MSEADPSDPTGTDVKNLMPLTKTELPNIPGNNISQGLAPNTENSNPFFLSNGYRLNIQDAANLGLVFAVLDLNSSICQAQEVQIVKTGDRAAAQPGDPVIYRFSVRNIASSSLNNVVVTDILPLECNFLPKSVRAELGNTPVQITTIYDESRE